MPMCRETVMLTPKTAMMSRTMGSSQVGRAAISVKVFLGSKKIPATRDRSFIPAGWRTSAFSGDISRRLYSNLRNCGERDNLRGEEPNKREQNALRWRIGGRKAR